FWTHTEPFPGVELKASQKPQHHGVYTMFHGTSIASARLIIANGFKQSTGGMLGKGVYVSRDKKKAAHYPLNSNNTDRVILELRVRVGRVKRIDKDNHPLQYTWHSHGYDTAWVIPNGGLKAVRSGLEEDCVFDPKRVKVVGIANAPNPIVQKELQHGVYTMFHGTSVANARLIIANGFQQSSGGMLGKGVYVSRNKKKADRYPMKRDSSDRVVFELRVRVGRVKRIDKDNHPMQYTWSTQGYDTAWVPPKCGMTAVPSGLEEDCVFDPKQVKVVVPLRNRWNKDPRLYGLLGGRGMDLK
uniref:Grass carp reovirus (GCRV)-induced gene 2p n=1 Tax=Cyclopterus lumpus TaxID=8103 RepID=A0A8C3ARK4_CYCLU